MLILEFTSDFDVFKKDHRYLAKKIGKDYLVEYKREDSFVPSDFVKVVEGSTLSVDQLIFGGYSPNTPHSRGRPLSIEQALWEMSSSTWTDMVEKLFPDYPQDVSVDDIITLIRETSNCIQIDGGHEVWIDEKGDFKIKVFDAQS